jgi:hypothetical protein
MHNSYMPFIRSCIFILYPTWNIGPLFGVSVITHTRHTVGLLWTNDQPVAETSAYTGQQNTQTQETNIHAPNGIRTPDPSNQAAVDCAATEIGFTYLQLM